MQLEQPQAIRTIFFDAGFTLLHPNPSAAEICQQVCARIGLHIHLDEMRQRLNEAEEFFFSQSRLTQHTWASNASINEFWLDYYMNLLRPFVEEHDEPRLYQLAVGINEEFDRHTSWQLFPDVLPTLQALKARNYTLGVISDWGSNLGPILQRLDLNKYFDSLLISAVTRHAKPSPTLYETALIRANAVADYTLHIGDSYVLDVLGARAVGIIPVLLDRQERLAPTHVDCLLIHSLYEVLKLLEIDEPAL